MSKKVTRYIVALVVLAIAATVGVFYAVAQHNKPLTDKQFAQLLIEQQFEKAPAGHYVHLRKDDPALYRTSWSKQKFNDYFLYSYGHVKTKPDGTSNAKSTLGTNHTFKDSKLVVPNQENGELGTIFSALSGNSKFDSGMTYYEEDAYNWYFNDLNTAQKDADVSANVTQIVR
ncbi:hypothetical protein EFL69_06500 [Weissella confusa]|uniref:hypothetical protein n=1 Tax=Weissella confusa TaxID=1583 RepID=UPI00223B1B20|nr:hypothetical protein [Weissella confusa]MCS9992729.1 hypothetical protein [Weissella confusa]